MKLKQGFQLAFLAVVMVALAAVGGVSWNASTSTLTLPTVANDTLAAGDSVNIGAVTVNWSRWDWAEITVAVDIDSVATALWRVETSEDGTTWHTVATQLDSMLADLALGTAGANTFSADSSMSVYLVRPAIGAGTAAMGIGMDMTKEARALAFAEYMRVNWYQTTNVDSTDSTTMAVTFRLGKQTY